MRQPPCWDPYYRTLPVYSRRAEYALCTRMCRHPRSPAIHACVCVCVCVCVHECKRTQPHDSRIYKTECVRHICGRPGHRHATHKHTLTTETTLSVCMCVLSWTKSNSKYTSTDTHINRAKRYVVLTHTQKHTQCKPICWDHRSDVYIYISCCMSF
jgi:hypothetical protein